LTTGSAEARAWAGTLTQLLASGALDRVAGVALGAFDGYPSEPGALPLAEIIRHHLEPLGVPVLGGLPVGHGVACQPAVPTGVPAILDVAGGTLTVEPAVA